MEKKGRTLTRNEDHKHTETYLIYFNDHRCFSQSEESKCMWTHGEDGINKRYIFMSKFNIGLIEKSIDFKYFQNCNDDKNYSYGIMNWWYFTIRNHNTHTYSKSDFIFQYIHTYIKHIFIYIKELSRVIQEPVMGPILFFKS